MSNPLVHAFFLGRATAEVLSEKAEHLVTDLLSNAGKFDAEQRERLRQFTQEVVDRADINAATVKPTSPTDEADLQEMMDELRAEIAQLRAALQAYRQKSDISL